jgi:hypothetical protein
MCLSTPPFCCVSFSVPCLSFFCMVLVSLPQEAILVYPSSCCGNTACRLFAHLLVWVSQAGLEPASAGEGALLFSQCNVAWRSFVRAGGSRCQTFDSS